MPPMAKFQRKAIAKSIGTVTQTRPRQSVPNAVRNTNPVGIEISSVVAMYQKRSSGAQPETNSWCAQTRKLRTTTPRMPRMPIL